MPSARRFGWNAIRPFGDFMTPTQLQVRQFARHVHLRRFRLLGINGSAPFPMAAVEIGSKNRFFGNHLVIDADLFRYRYGGYRLMLPVGRYYYGVAAVFPSLGMTSRTTGAELDVAYKLSPRDHAGLIATYALARRSSVLNVATAERQITNVSSLQIVPSYEHILPLPHGRSLTFDAAAVYRSSARVTDPPPGPLAEASPTGSLGPYVRKSDTTHFDASLTYKSSPRFSVSAFVRNITDVRPDRSTTLTTGNLVNPSTVSAVRSEPRTFGVILSSRL